MKLPEPDSWAGFEFLRNPKFFLSDQLRVLIKRLGVSQTKFSEISDIDKGLLSRILNGRDRRGLTKKQIDDLVEGLRLYFPSMGEDEVLAWKKTLQCWASLERTLRRMFPQEMDLTYPEVQEAAERMIPSIFAEWEASNGSRPVGMPTKPTRPPKPKTMPNYAELLKDFEQCTTLEKTILWLTAIGLSHEQIFNCDEFKAMGPTAVEYARSRLREKSWLLDIPKERLFYVIKMYDKIHG